MMVKNGQQILLTGRHRAIRKEGTDPILIDFIKDELQPLPCVAFSGDKMESYLLAFLGDLLAEIYSRYQSRLLESNVRAFLQATTKTNKAIQTTIANEPQRFFAYNNGIIAIASNAEVSEHHYQQCITKIEDLQIVNGGKTTASMLYARDQKRGLEENLSQVFVQAKLTVLDGEETGDLINQISRYSNTQNKSIRSRLASSN